MRIGVGLRKLHLRQVILSFFIKNDRKLTENDRKRPKTTENEPKTENYSKTIKNSAENERKRRRNEAFEFDSNCQAP